MSIPCRWIAFTPHSARAHSAPAALHETVHSMILILLGSIPLFIKFIKPFDHSCRLEKGFMEISRDVAYAGFGVIVEIVLHR